MVTRRSFIRSAAAAALGFSGLRHLLLTNDLAAAAEGVAGVAGVAGLARAEDTRWRSAIRVTCPGPAACGSTVSWPVFWSLSAKAIPSSPGCRIARPAVSRRTWYFP